MKNWIVKSFKFWTSNILPSFHNQQCIECSNLWWVCVLLSTLGTTLVTNAMQYLFVFLILPCIIMILNDPKCFWSFPLKQGIISFFCYNKPFMNETWVLLGYCILTCRLFSQSPLWGDSLFSHWLPFMIMCKTYFLFFFSHPWIFFLICTWLCLILCQQY